MEEYNYVNVGICNVILFLFLNFLDLNNIVVDEEVDDVNVDIDDSDDCELKYLSMLWDSGRCVVEFGVFVNVLVFCKNCINFF